MAMNSDRLPLENKTEEHLADSLYLRNQRKSRLFLALLAVILLLSLVLSLWAGSYETPVAELLRGIFGKASDEKINIVVRNVRLPRICTAVAAGAGLGVTGCILQAILNNPLASSSTLGVSQGAGFGAAFAIIVLGAGTSGSGIGVSLCAFIGSMAVAAVIFALSKFKQVSAESIVLAGVAISSMFTGATTLLQYFADGVRVRNIEADSLYAGIMIDTDNFQQKTGVRTFEAAAFLRRCGADVTRVRKLFRENMNDYRAKGETISNAEIFLDCFAISECPGDYVDSPTVIGSQAANELLNVIGVKASFVLTEYRGVIYVSARAIDEVNVQIIMERMGGGGHLNMAGCQLETGMNEAKRILKETLTEMLEEGEI